ncbi:unnamed protein product [Rotaria magnacalcarata]|uniref:Uncharacterized protein n=1 Tax=Rotaria magnacalcarata TaxID=392030 RepID=A0A820E280_9BILA|nr:unnamed protein product [Rotaria magnacalcarata]CAF4140690.1 unnamed protein product [Rotaria magnacalcarata]CAF4241453.1 unnamed protein product [Rotaria magnacalcarata]CAF4268767.1 unnamed protein product [Rotaria magnacalcarata]
MYSHIAHHCNEVVNYDHNARGKTIITMRDLVEQSLRAWSNNNFVEFTYISEENGELELGEKSYVSYTLYSQRGCTNKRFLGNNDWSTGSQAAYNG